MSNLRIIIVNIPEILKEVPNNRFSDIIGTNVFVENISSYRCRKSSPWMLNIIIEEVLPSYTLYLRNLESLRPETPEIQTLQTLKIAWEKQTKSGQRNRVLYILSKFQLKILKN